MAKHRLQTIEIQNFKAFPANQKFELGGNHALIWGVNGSGKSSIYWSLYTLLQCSNKEADGHIKYFNGGDESLLNLYGGATPGLIRLSFKEDGNPDIVPYEISMARNDVHGNVFIKGLNNSSEFITHRLLLNFSNFSNAEVINLFPIFKRDIFPYFNTPQGNNYGELLKTIETQLNIESPSNLKEYIDEFNNGLQDLIQPIIRDDVSKFYKKYLTQPGEEIDIKIHFPELLSYTGNKGKRQLSYPVITLRTRFGKAGTAAVPAVLHNINKAQSFYNEARINAIALSIRFVLMRGRKNDDELNLLVLDDLLISLDLHNRKKVVDVILNEFAKDYQIIIFTHDKGFFNEMIRQVSDDIENWTAFRLYETPVDQNPKVELDKAGNLDKAIEYFAKKDYESCSLYLRKETEETLSKYIDPDLKFIWSSKEWKGLAEFIISAEKRLTSEQIRKVKMLFSRTDIADADYDLLKTQIETDAALIADIPKLGKLKTFRTQVFQTLKEIKQQKDAGKDVVQLMENVKQIKDRVLNAGAHFSEAPFYQEEIEEAIETVIKLRETLTKQSVTRYIDACREAGMNI